MSYVEELARGWLGFLSRDLIRYAIFAVATWLTLWVVLARPLARRKIRPQSPPARQLLVEFLMSIRSVAIFSTVGLSLAVLERAGLLWGPAVGAGLGSVWFWTSLVLMIVAHDAWFYWGHRLMHRPALFRTFHRRHHRSHNPSPFTAYSFDLAEAAVQGAFVPVWMMATPTPWGVVGLFMIHQILRNTIGHSGYELFPARRDGRPLIPFLTTVTHHDLHHAQAGWNYGLYFTWWDRWMGTEHPEYLARFAQAAGRAPALKPALAATLALALLAIAAPSPSQAQPLRTVAGDWATEGLGGVVRLGPCAENRAMLCGRLLWVWDERRVKPGMVGAEIIHGLAWRDDAWRDGTLLNPEDGKTYRGSIRFIAGTARVSGCVGPMCRNQVWRPLAAIPRP